MKASVTENVSNGNGLDQRKSLIHSCKILLFLFSPLSLLSLLSFSHITISFLNQVPKLIFVNKDGRLDPTFSSGSNYLMDAARINATYVPSSAIGSCTSNGTYDEQIGNLERNMTDFVSMPTSLEVLWNNGCQFPVTFDTILRQENNYILSSPVRNVTKTVSSIHQAFYVFDWSVILLLVAVYSLSLWLLQASKAINNSRQTYVWTLTRIWFHQDEGSSPSSQSGKTIFTTSKLFVFHIVIILSALINTDLVTYSKPKLIDTVSDAIESGIKIAFSKGSGTYSILKSAPDGSERKIFFIHALNQSRNQTSDIFGDSDRKVNFLKVANHSLLKVIGYLSYEVALRLECLGTGLEIYHRSREIIFSDGKTILFSRSCDPEVRYRVNRVYVKAMESGIITKQYEDYADSVSLIFNGALAPVSCVFRDRSKSDKGGFLGDQFISYQDFNPFILHISRIYIVCALVLIFEIILMKGHLKDSIRRRVGRKLPTKRVVRRGMRYARR